PSFLCAMPKFSGVFRKKPEVPPGRASGVSLEVFAYRMNIFTQAAPGRQSWTVFLPHGPAKGGEQLLPAVAPLGGEGDQPILLPEGQGLPDAGQVGLDLRLFQLVQLV